MSFRPPGDCPNCGEAVPGRAKACPHCGATKDAGWDDHSASDGLDLPDDEFDYDDFAEREFGTPAPRRPRHQSRRIWIGVSLLLVVSMVWYAWGWLF